MADKDKIENVINNLIGNAIKYSKPDNKAIKIYVESNDLEVIIKVSDNGFGIPENAIPNLFDRYYRVENKKTENISGFGIGLYLCSEIIKRHSGRIWVESTFGIGSNFYFSIPHIPRDLN